MTYLSSLSTWGERSNARAPDQHLIDLLTSQSQGKVRTPESSALDCPSDVCMPMMDLSSPCKFKIACQIERSSGQPENDARIKRSMGYGQGGTP
jgi:hypothetical protein